MDMVERVAQALFVEMALDPDWDDAPLTDDQRVDDDDDPSQEECRHLARAAIEAMREPTEEMIMAGADSAFGLVEPYTALRENGVPLESDLTEEDAKTINDDMKQSWRKSYVAAFNAALAETPSRPDSSPHTEE